MGLIYVNPEGPDGNPDPLAAARDIRETFGRMAMNDEETVALIAGGHTFGKTHGAADPDQYVGPEPEGAGIEEQGLGWRQRLRHRQGSRRHHLRPRGHLDLHAGAVEQRSTSTTSTASSGSSTSRPAGAWQCRPWTAAARTRCPTRRPASSPASRRCSSPTSRCKVDPVYERDLARASSPNPDEFADAFARAWFKLTHRDMGPIQRYLGSVGADRGR